MPARDLKKLMKDLYAPPTEPVLVEVPPLNYLMIDGAGDPETGQDFAAATEALYAVAYATKFLVKGRDEALDFVVPPLEGLWWAEDTAAFSLGERDAWLWTLMIMMPEPVDQALYLEGHRAACRKKCLLAAEEMRFEALEEGLSAQITHIGPYAEEAPTIARLHEFIGEQGRTPGGKHHEIYLSDPRRSAPEKMRTVLRQPLV